MKKYDIVGIDMPNVDLAVNLRKFPRPNGGEPIRELSWQGGGKIASGLVASARFGAKCAVIGAVGDILPEHCSVLDAGCGEGWYINRLDVAFGRKAGIAAVDVSPNAAAMTAGLFQKSERMRRVFCAAASVNSLPVESGSVDVLLSIFSPLAPDEFSRAVRAGGLVIRAVPTARHLWQLKETLYERPYENDETPRPLQGFEPVSVKRVEYGMTVNGAEDIKALYSMTPYYRKTGSDDERKLLSLDRLDTEAGFIVTAYRRLN